MKKADMIKLVKEWNIDIAREVEIVEHNCFNEMQELAVSLGCPRLCSISGNFINIVRAKNVSESEIKVAESLYETYHMVIGENEALCNFLLKTDNFNL